MISLLQLGTVDYATGLCLQQQLVALRKEEKLGDVLLLLDHSPVITLGRNAKATNVVASPELLAQRGVELFECDRGGDVTFHGPGQIVGYAIFDLRGHARGAADASSAHHKHLGAVDFVRQLEEVLIRTCADFAIPTKRVQGLTGVWTDAESKDAHLEASFAHVGTGALARPVERSSTASAELSAEYVGKDDREGHDFSRAERAPDTEPALAAEVRPESKLAAIGIHISRSVTSHGFALNVNTDLSYFNLIVPCGITAKPVTSMQQELHKPLDMNAVAESISRNFGIVFKSQMLWIEALDSLLGDAIAMP